MGGQCRSGFGAERMFGERSASSRRQNNMPRPLKQTPMAQTRRLRKRLRAELDRVTDYVQQKVAEAVAEGLFDDPLPTAEPGAMLEGRIIDGDVVIIDPPAPKRRRRRLTPCR
jgi:hypothetical protein